MAGTEVIHQVTMVEVKPVELDPRDSETISDEPIGSTILDFLPTPRSGSFVDIGTRKDMEDEHIRIDDLRHFLALCSCAPHTQLSMGCSMAMVVTGPDAASYIRRHALRFFFQDACFPQAPKFDPIFFTEVENLIRRSLLQLDLTMADDCIISSSCGSTALTALVFGRHL